MPEIIEHKGKEFVLKVDVNAVMDAMEDQHTADIKAINELSDEIAKYKDLIKGLEQSVISRTAYWKTKTELADLKLELFIQDLDIDL